MKRILVLTNVYPASDMPSTATPIVHYFAKEWVAMGYDVRVIHYKAAFPDALIKFVNFIKNYIKINTPFVLSPVIVRDREFEMDGVNVTRFMIPKLRPHTLFIHKHIVNAIDKTVSFLERENFTPDVIVSHWANPQLEIMSALKQRFNCRTCYVAHGESEVNIYKERGEALLNDVDIIGFRSDYTGREFKKLHKWDKPSFNCYSGIPEKFICEECNKNLDEITNFLYVGTLIPRKHPVSVLPALKDAMGDFSFHMSYVGNGPESKKIAAKCKELGIQNYVELAGRVSRDEVIRYLDKSEVFVMISSGEAFGLVYLEAMSHGCITIASKKEGFDGIIKDGYNGFLCEAGNSDELASIIRKIREMSIKERHRISENAIETAKSLTDKKAAKYYLEQILPS